MKILLFGKNGQVGWELQRSLAPLGELVALETAHPDLCGDLTNLDGIAQTLHRVAPDIIVNAAAYTAVDKAESEADKARLINAQAPALLAEQAAKKGALLIHYSTDYVFDGSGTQPWREEDPTGPLNIYGATKLEGEKAIQASSCRHLIFRTSWVYAARGNNFAKTMLRLGKERDKLSVINDQTGAPTGADLIADITAQVMRQALRQPEICGLYHLVAAGETTWHDYASFVLAYARNAGVELKVAPDAIQPIPTSAFPTPARRPANSRLETSKLQTAADISFPDWKIGVARMLAEIL